MTASELNYPAELPVCAMRTEIIDALKSSRVVVISGDTGSGKTTQLPKMALELGLGGSGRRIACTQPRRIAAVTMAERVAAELKSQAGGLVGYRHRFARRVSPETRIEFLTDGILLAETRNDPLFNAYEAIIVDEAHERSLNIDFLLGLLKRALERRKDLKVVISSATLDTDRFTAFFPGARRIEVPGRMYPVEIRHLSPAEDDERDLPRDVDAAISTLPPDGDILVFLPGERDIRETAELLSGRRGGRDEILALYASLPAGEQRRAFMPSPKRKIILATNVAETSLTIPGIRAVVDSGLARISRYIHRTKIQRLQIEPVSKASSRQRSGRCGRVGPGICVRLYSREDYESRDDFTPPEILRSSLAGVILTMLDLRLGDIDRFDFIDPPKPAMVREGLKELLELGAIRRSESGGAELTPVGRKLAKIPLEPRLARILLEASRNAQLASTVPLVAAMACDDPRRRPFEEREAADRAHARFRVPGSDFLGTLALWKWWLKETADLSESKKRRLCKKEFLSYSKMRQWKELVRQLEQLSQRLGLGGGETGSEDGALIHRSLLAGLLSRIGKFDEETRDWRGAHQLRFTIHPSSVLKRKTPAWIMAGELVDTERLFARNVAEIDPRWIEPAAGPICRHSCHSPEWDGQSGYVRATERVSVYGLVVIPARRCDYSRVNFAHAREIFIRCGIIGGDFPRPSPPIKKNLEIIASLRRRAERIRRPEAFDGDGLEKFFNLRIPPDIAGADALRKWLRTAGPEELGLFTLRESDWWKADKEEGFPDVLRIAGRTLKLSYRHCPDDPENDGVTCTVKKTDTGVLKLWNFDCLVPGMLPEKLHWHLTSLPSQYRRLLSPIDEAASILLPLIKPGKLPLAEELTAAIRGRWGFSIPPEAWKTAQLPMHLKMRFRLIDEKTGKTLAVTRDPGKLTENSPAPGVGKNAGKSVSWTFGRIPESVAEKNSVWQTSLYPALRDENDGVSLQLFADAGQAAAVHSAGVTRLYLLTLGKSARIAFRRDRLDFAAALYLKNADYPDERISEDLLYGAVAESLVRDLPPVRTLDEFNRRPEERRTELAKISAEMHELFKSAVRSAAEISGMLEDGRLRETTVESVSTQLAYLMYRGFPRNVPLPIFRNYARYLRGASMRLTRAKTNPSGDTAKEEIFAPWWERYRTAARPGNIAKANATALREFRWMLEEFRISLFAQELHTPYPVSPKRLEAKWLEVGFTG